MFVLSLELNPLPERTLSGALQTLRPDFLFLSAQVFSQAFIRPIAIHLCRLHVAAAFEVENERVKELVKSGDPDESIWKGLSRWRRGRRCTPPCPTRNGSRELVYRRLENNRVRSWLRCSCRRSSAMAADAWSRSFRSLKYQRGTALCQVV